MLTSLFSYDLPKSRIAQHSVEPRDHSRLLVLHKDTGTTEHKKFFEIGSELHAGDLLVVNETKVFKARLRGSVDAHNVEVFLLRPEADESWIALAQPGKRLSVGSVIRFRDGSACNVLEKQPDGVIRIGFGKDPQEIISWTEKFGDIPVPPYVTEQPTDLDEYQTVYAKQTGSVAAPTAGFHFTTELIDQMKNQGIRFATVTLHVGMGTFRPMKTDTIEEHVMHEEWIDVPEETMQLISETKQNGNRVIAVGTTTVRALESDIRHGFTNIFITPGYTFKVIDALITNFHLPKSTLLVLVSAFAGANKTDPDDGRKMILNTYHEAIEKDYRFYSFGDAMLIED